MEKAVYFRGIMLIDAQGNQIGFCEDFAEHMQAHPDITYELLQEALGKVDVTKYEPGFKNNRKIDVQVSQPGYSALVPVYKKPEDSQFFVCRKKREVPSHVTYTPPRESYFLRVIVTPEWKIRTAFYFREDDPDPGVEPWSITKDHSNQELYQAIENWSHFALSITQEELPQKPYLSTWREEIIKQGFENPEKYGHLADRVCRIQL